MQIDKKLIKKILKNELDVDSFSEYIGSSGDNLFDILHMLETDGLISVSFRALCSDDGEYWAEIVYYSDKLGHTVILNPDVVDIMDNINDIVRIIEENEKLAEEVESKIVVKNE